jgi:hypothetical protein
VIPFSFFLLVLGLSSLALAQSDIQVDLLKQQVTFLNTANAEMRSMYEAALTNLRWLLGGGALAFVVAIWDLSRRLNAKVEQRLTEQLDRSIKSRIETLERLVGREDVIGTSHIAYVRPLEGDHRLPAAFHLLQARGFSSVEFSKSLAYVQEQDDVIVLDLGNVDISNNDVVTRYLEEAKHKLRSAQFCVVFVRGQSPAVRSMLEAWDRLGAANFPLTLVSACVDAVHLAYSLQNTSDKPKGKS